MDRPKRFDVWEYEIAGINGKVAAVELEIKELEERRDALKRERDHSATEFLAVYGERFPEKTREWLEKRRLLNSPVETVKRRNLRKAAGYTVEDVSRILKIMGSRVRQLDVQGYSAERAAILASLFGCDPKDLMR